MPTCVLLCVLFCIALVGMLWELQTASSMLAAMKTRCLTSTGTATDSKAGW